MIVSDGDTPDRLAEFALRQVYLPVYPFISRRGGLMWGWGMQRFLKRCMYMPDSGTSRRGLGRWGRGHPNLSMDPKAGKLGSCGGKKELKLSFGGHRDTTGPFEYHLKVGGVIRARLTKGSLMSYIRETYVLQSTVQFLQLL